VVDELDPEEFFSLPDERGPRGKVDYQAVLNEILAIGKALTIKRIGEIMIKHANGKNKVYYSEVTNWLERLAGQGEYEVIVKFKSKKFVLIRRKA